MSEITSRPHGIAETVTQTPKSELIHQLCW